ncbi:MAG: response regulator transcription factor [Sulfuriflexus sp.]|nr:response regulator transcription factor [Sulfuriflexus sp.]
MRTEPAVVIIDDSDDVRATFMMLMGHEGLYAVSYRSGEEFLRNRSRQDIGCVVLDVRMPGVNGMELHEYFRRINLSHSVIMISAYGDVRMAVRAMKNGVFDFLEKPFNSEYLLERIKRCMAQCEHDYDKSLQCNRSLSKIRKLTAREREVMSLLVDGNQNKHIARKLDISPRTVELHRAKVMKKLNARTLSDVVRIKFEVDIFDS